MLVDEQEKCYRAADVAPDSAAALEAAESQTNVFLNHLRPWLTEDEPIGVVDGIVSIDEYQVEIRGFANHAGTTMISAPPYRAR